MVSLAQTTRVKFSSSDAIDQQRNNSPLSWIEVGAKEPRVKVYSLIKAHSSCSAESCKSANLILCSMQPAGGPGGLPHAYYGQSHGERPNLGRKEARNSFSNARNASPLGLFRPPSYPVGHGPNLSFQVVSMLVHVPPVNRHFNMHRARFPRA